MVTFNNYDLESRTSTTGPNSTESKENWFDSSTEELTQLDALEKATQSGDLEIVKEATYKVACHYHYGTGKIQQCFKTAADCYAILAEQNHPESQCRLGWFYLKGKGVTQSDEKAVELFNKAAKQNHAKAQYALGYFYDVVFYDKKSTQSESIEKARYWYTKAAAQNHPQAVTALEKLNSKEKTASCISCVIL